MKGEIMMSSLASQLAKMDISKMKSPTGQTYGELLRKEARHLANCIQYRIEEYLDSYEPVIYQRTDSFRNSLTVEDLVDIKVIGNTLSMNILFDDDSYHPSGYGIDNWSGNRQTANVAMLINYGYQVRSDVWFSHIENFGFRRPQHFIENGVKDFNATNSLGIRIEIHNPLLSFG